MTEAWGQFVQWIREKTSSPIYFTFLAYYIAWNWKIFHVLFIEDHSKFLTPRVEYVERMQILSFGEWTILETPFEWLCHIVPPAVFTFLTIKYLPRVYNWALGMHLDDVFFRKEMYYKKKLSYEKLILNYERATEKVIDQQKKSVETQISTKESIQQAKSDEREWDIEIIQCINTNWWNSTMKDLVRVLYENNGLVRDIDDYNREGARILTSESLAHLHTRGLVSIIEKNNHEAVDLTAKGKYFVYSYLKRIQE